MSPAPPPPGLGNILSGKTTEHNASLSPVAEDLLSLFKQEFADQLQHGQKPRFYTVLHWCRAALEERYSINRILRGWRELRAAEWITLKQGGRAPADWVWYSGVVRPGPLLKAELAAGAEWYAEYLQSQAGGGK